MVQALATNEIGDVCTQAKALHPLKKSSTNTSEKWPQAGKM